MAQFYANQHYLVSEEMKRQYPFWIKERYNPQLGVYYVACGQMSKTAARKHERTLYGENIMHCFNSEAEYVQELNRLKKRRERVQ